MSTLNNVPDGSYWTIIGKGTNSRKVICRCKCGTVKELYKSHITSGRSMSCGCLSSDLKRKAFLNDCTGKQINDWTILEELGKDRVRCKCSCGTEAIIAKSTVLDGRSKSCGHNTNKFNDLTGEIFNNWTIIEELGHGFVRVRCACENHTETVIQKATVINGDSKSCGCLKAQIGKQTLLKKYGEITANKIRDPREAWQIATVNDKELFKNYITSNYTDKPTIKQLVKDLGIKEAAIGRKIKEFDCESLVELNPWHSNMEDEIYMYIKSIYSGVVHRRNKKLLHGNELDLYIPEKRLAIEINGDYWHSIINKDVRYHQIKTIQCASIGIRLIHIFEYEWNDDIKQSKLKAIIARALGFGVDTITYAKNTVVQEISNSEAIEFLNKYHLDNGINSNINIGCFSNNELIGVMTFGRPRYNYNYQYELYRLCWKDGVVVSGGSEKLISYFIKKYDPDSIITYVNIGKFTGNGYIKFGFKVNGKESITSPNYVWVEISQRKRRVLSRQQTQKVKLIEQGFGHLGSTEAEIMENLGFIRVYDSGNIRLTWNKSN